mmetsp:Transcript_100610/g.280206  ORF Transcript_100610/g.280206 Transcript_100610/m.280206 type:complete len:95 (-) Transcript_100610:263-547(-)
MELASKKIAFLPLLFLDGRLRTETSEFKFHVSDADEQPDILPDRALLTDLWLAARLLAGLVGGLAGGLANRLAGRLAGRPRWRPASSEVWPSAQ